MRSGVKGAQQQKMQSRSQSRSIRSSHGPGEREAMSTLQFAKHIYILCRHCTQCVELNEGGSPRAYVRHRRTLFILDRYGSVFDHQGCEVAHNTKNTNTRWICTLLSTRDEIDGCDECDEGDIYWLGPKWITVWAAWIVRSKRHRSPTNTEQSLK